jgi:head-tail adaptor
VTLRHRDGVRIGMRLKRRQRAFLILTAYDPDQSGRYLVCQVEETGEVA